MYATSRKTNEPNLRKSQKTSFRPDFGPFGPYSGRQFSPPPPKKNLAPSVTRYHGQLSSCTISEKPNDSILRKLSDGQTDESDFIGRCPTNVERPIMEKIKLCLHSWHLYLDSNNSSKHIDCKCPVTEKKCKTLRHRK